MSIGKSSSGLIAIAFVFAAVGQSQAEWSFIGLGTLGGEFSSALAVSADGQVVVGWSHDLHQRARAFRWQDGLMAELGLPGSGGATGVSHDGSVVVGDLGAGGMWRWHNGDIISLDTGAMPWAEATGVSGDGSMVVGNTKEGEWWQGTYWRPDETGDYQRHLLGALDEVRSSAYGISADGSVIVGTSSTTGGYEAFRWQDGVMVGLGTLGGKFSAARATSADGSVVVGDATKTDDQWEPFRWEDGTMLGLGTLPGDSGVTTPRAVSADGSVIVGFASNHSGSEPFIWDAGHGIRSLKDVLTEGGLDLTDWDLKSAWGISADGKVIVGTGRNAAAGRDEAWMATIPEPSTLAGLLTIAAMALPAHLCRRNRA